MKTKKAIIEWFDSKGNEMNDLNDLADFTSKIDSTIQITRDETSYNHMNLLTLNKSSWKYGMTLGFYKQTGECIKLYF